MNAGLKLAGVIGWPVDQSLSPLMHNHWLKQYGISGGYIPLAIRPEDFGACVAHLPKMGFAGANVTVPHKEAAFALSSELDDDARATGAVNTLTFAGRRTIGGNTDVSGFAASLKEALGEDAVRSGAATILGAGGAARGVALALRRMGAPDIRLVNRTKRRAEAVAARLGQSAPVNAMDWGDWSRAFDGVRLLVNATSLGMAGKAGLDVPLDRLPKNAAVADIVYNPLQTELLRAAKARGHRTMGGLGMLMHQGVPSFAAWFGVTPEVTPVLRAKLEEALSGA